MKRQGGMALILSLMAVTLLATLGFAAVQQTTLEFLLSRNQIDLRIATTSAQNGLSAQLSTLDTLPVADFLPHGNNGLYRSEAYAEAPLWLQQSTWRRWLPSSNLCAYGQCSARLCDCRVVTVSSRE